MSASLLTIADDARNAPASNSTSRLAFIRAARLDAMILRSMRDARRLTPRMKVRT